MSNVDGATRELRSFAQLSGQYQRAVVLKFQGVSYESIAEALRAEFGLSTTRNTVNQWFAGGGLLEQASREFNERLSKEGFQEAKRLLMRATLPAAVTLIRLLNDPNPLIQLRAATAILNKYIPDRQIIPDGPVEYELPEELSEIADQIILGERSIPIVVGS